MIRLLACSTVALVAAFAVIMMSSEAVRAQTASPAPYEINVILSLTGNASYVGTIERQTLGFVEQMVNKQGGIHGRPVKFVIGDDTSSPQVAVQIANGYIAKNVPLILGPNLTGTCAGIDPLVAKNGPVHYCLSPGPLPEPGSYAYAASAPIRYDAVAELRWFRSKGWHRVALIASTDASGQAFIDPLNAALALPENKNIKIVARESFALSDISVTAQMIRIRETKPQVLIALGTGTGFATLLHGMNDAGLTAIPTMGSSSNMSYAQLAQYTSFLPNELYFSARRAIIPDDVTPAAVRAAQTAFYNTFRANNIRPDLSNVLAWDTSMLIVDAMRKLGPDATAQQLQDYLQHLKGWIGVSGTYDFLTYPQRGLGESAVIIYAYDRVNNRFVLASKPGGR